MGDSGMLECKLLQGCERAATMAILVVVCLLLVIVSLLMVLNAMTRLDLLRRHNESMQKELAALRQDYQHLQAQFFPGPDPLASRQQPEPPAEEDPRETAREQLLNQMFAYQKVLERYAHKQAGRYPSCLEYLINYAENQGLQQKVRNPYSGLYVPLFSPEAALDITHDPADEGLAEYAGRILYQAQLNPEGVALGYTLAAFDDKGMLLKSAEGEIITLSAEKS